MRRVLIWGIGAEYNKNINLLKYYATYQINVIGITDRSIKSEGMLDGFKLIPISDICECYFDNIIIMSEKHYHEILKDAIELTGISSDRVFPSRVFKVPYFDFDTLTSISETHYSIISNNCWAGMLCYTLGIECRSPFKNVSISDFDYLKLVVNFDYYMKLDPMWTEEWELDQNNGKEVPMLILGDIKVKCNHYPDPFEAIDMWKRRKAKVNNKRLIYEMYTESPDVANEFIGIKTANKKICFVPFSTSLTDCNTLLNDKQKKFYEVVNSQVDMNAGGHQYNIFSVFMDELIYR